MDKITLQNVKYETICDANWQVKQVGAAYVTQCRVCKTIAASGGTPKCLKNG